MDLDVIVPTFNRAWLLPRALASLAAAPRSESLRVRVLVVDNNSTDGTSGAVERFAASSPIEIRCIFERRQGRSHALNAGLAAATADLVGFIDDDEEITPGWYQVVEREFQDLSLDYAGGPYLPRWEIDPPAWLPRDLPSVIGWSEAIDEPRPFGPDYPGILLGGNAVIRREVLERVGGFDVRVGRTGGRLLSGEDYEYYTRLIHAGARGMYFPELAIVHFIPADRLTKSYFRRWMFGDGMSHGILGQNTPERVPLVFGIPRYRIGAALRAAPRWVAALRKRRPDLRFAAELEVRHLAGYIAGRFGSSTRSIESGGPLPDPPDPVELGQSAYVATEPGRER